MYTSRKPFTRYKDKKTTITVGNKQTILLPGRGNIKTVLNGRLRIIHGILHVPGLGFNLFSISVFKKRGLSISFDKGLIKIKRGNILITAGRQVKNLYYLAGVFKKFTLIVNKKSIIKNLTRNFFNVKNDKVSFKLLTFNTYGR